MAVEHLHKVELDPDACRLLAAGRPVKLPEGVRARRPQTVPKQSALPIELAVVDCRGELVAIARPIPPAGTIRAKKVLCR
jgi:hypothetical protein